MAHTFANLLWREDEASLFLRRTTGFAVFLAALLATAGLLAVDFVEGWQRRITGNVTIQLYADPPPYGDTENAATEDAENAAAPAHLTTALNIVRTAPGVTEARLLTPHEMSALLAPWLGGDAALIKELPAPLLVDAKVARKAGFDALRLEAELLAQGIESVVHDHVVWFKHNHVLLSRIGELFFLLLAMVAFATAVAMTHAARNAFLLRLESIEIVSLVGAEDTAIATRFALQAFRSAFSGAVAGVVFAAVVLMLADLAWRDGGFRLLDLAAAERLQLWLMLALLPPASAALAAATSWANVYYALAQNPQSARGDLSPRTPLLRATPTPQPPP